METHINTIQDLFNKDNETKIKGGNVIEKQQRIRWESMMTYNDDKEYDNDDVYQYTDTQLDQVVIGGANNYSSHSNEYDSVQFYSHQEGNRREPVIIGGSDEIQENLPKFVFSVDDMLQYYKKNFNKQPYVNPIKKKVIQVENPIKEKATQVENHTEKETTQTDKTIFDLINL